MTMNDTQYFAVLDVDGITKGRKDVPTNIELL